MSQTNFTPGPWNNTGGFHITALSGGRTRSVVAEIDRHAWTPPGEAQANAQLIATAPEMFQLLTELLEHGIYETYKDRVEELLNKATAKTIL